MASATEEDDRPITGINVTPLVDVTLVLLIVFMVTAQTIVTRAMPIDPPKANDGRAVATAQTLVITIEENGTRRIDGRIVGPGEIAAEAARVRARDGKDARAVIRAADGARHGVVVGALDALHGAGVDKIAFGVKRP